jgi:insulysin
MSKNFIYAILIFLSGNCFLYSDPAPLPYTIIQNKATLPLLTPTFSDRKVLKLKLANQLEVQIVSDPKLDKSSAALIVKVGSWNDPKQYPGIAHFLEHMLFLGTKKYPKESEYDQVINENDGISNAFTASDFTAFMFSISNAVFPEVLDRFSSFFKEPLFNPSGVARELHAIDQEYVKNLENDDIREYFVHKELSNPDHPHHAFTMGNKNSLSNVSQTALKRFYKQNYSANLMRLLVYSPLPLDQLRDLVIKDFQDIPNYNREPFNSNMQAKTNAVNGHFVFIEPIKNVRKLSLIWELPQKFGKMRDVQPDAIICSVLGHEGKESLLAELKRENLAEDLKCGSSLLGSNISEFYIEIELTAEGIKHLDRVIERCFQAIANFKEKGIQKYLFDELHQMGTITYQYQQRDDEFNSIMKEAMLIPNEDMSTYPEQSLIIQKYDPAFVRELLDYLTPWNCQFDVLASSQVTGVKPDHKEKWLGVEYAIQPIPAAKLDEWSKVKPISQIDLPAPNDFIPQALTLVNQKNSTSLTEFKIPTPLEITNNERAKIFFAPDEFYFSPEVSWTIQIKTPFIMDSDPMKVVLADLFVKSVNEDLSKFSYSASLAGLDYQIKREVNGISIKIQGYSDKAIRLFDEILKRVTNTRLNQQNFKVFKDTLLRQYQNFAFEMPIKQAMELVKKVIYKNFTLEKDKAIALKKITLEMFNDYASQIFKENFIEGMLYGNLTESEAKNISNLLLSSFDSSIYPKEARKKPEVIILPKTQGPFFIDFKTRSQGNAAILIIQDSDFSLKARAAQQILVQAMTSPFFVTLRTKQQTGYIVYNIGQEIQKQLYYLFAVQSSSHDPRDLLARYELFIESFLQEINTDFSETRFDSVKQTLLQTLKQPPKNIAEMGELLNLLAFTYEEEFDWIAKRIKGMNELTYPEFIGMTSQVMSHNNKERLGILLRGVLPEDRAFSFSKICPLSKLQQISEYSTGANR